MSHTDIKIPNEIGRLDDVIAAMSDGKWNQVGVLLSHELHRRNWEVDSAQAQLDRVRAKRDSVKEFLSLISTGNYQATRAEIKEMLNR